jgi:hypothetical protein
MNKTIHRLAFCIIHPYLTAVKGRATRPCSVKFKQLPNNPDFPKFQIKTYGSCIKNYF